ncbi:phosphatase PAP2 family protein [Candidatus Saccharibacteria bacterium]|nr:phosphatase PAP2 family protein [Candidatus Saccharibacteria bacterium]
MEKSYKKYFILAGVFAVISIIFTVLVTLIDVKLVGAGHTAVGFSAINDVIFRWLGTSTFWDKFSDYCLLFSIFIMLCFAAFGLFQWIKRKNLKKVDIDIFLLGGTYMLLFALYFIFDHIVINYRPVLEEGQLINSFPSSHIMCIIGVIATTIFELPRYIKSKTARVILTILLIIFMGVSAFARVASGMHWFTDVLAAIFFGLTIAFAFMGAQKYLTAKPAQKA